MFKLQLKVNFLNAGLVMIRPGSPLLSIAIPTYNRPEQLACLLDSILCQYVPGMSLEIFVSDNSDDNRTTDLIERYKHYLPIGYTQHQRNIGGCRNFISSVGASKGAYCWIVGDDDLIARGSITLILDVLTSHPDVPGIVCGYSYQQEDTRLRILAELRQPSMLPLMVNFDAPNFIDIEFNGVLEKWEDSFFLTQIPSLHTSILSCIFNRALWKQYVSALAKSIPTDDIIISDEFDLLDTTFPHSLTWARMFVGRPVYLLSRPLAYLFYGGQDWLAKWPALMFTRCLGLADFFAELGADPAAVLHYKRLILMDSSLHGVIVANDAYTRRIFSLEKLVSSNSGSKELFKNIGNLLRRTDIPFRSKLNVIVDLMSGGQRLKNLYRLYNSQDLPRGPLALIKLAMLSGRKVILKLFGKSNLLSLR